jgi:hypothetical protein
LTKPWKGEQKHQPISPGSNKQTNKKKTHKQTNKQNKTNKQKQWQNSAMVSQSATAC